MDSGYLAPGETLEDDYDVLKELLPEEVIGIMDQMLCYEVSTVSQNSSRNKNISDADTRSSRWHGTWAIHFPRPSSHPSTLTVFYGRNQRRWTRRASIEEKTREAKIASQMLYFGHTVWER